MEPTVFFLVLALSLAFALFRILQGENVGTVECPVDRHDPGIRLRLTIVRHRPKGLEPTTIDFKASMVFAVRLHPMSREQALALAGHLEEAARLTRE